MVERKIVVSCPASEQGEIIPPTIEMCIREEVKSLGLKVDYVNVGTGENQRQCLAIYNEVGSSYLALESAPVGSGLRWNDVVCLLEIEQTRWARRAVLDINPHCYEVDFDKTLSVANTVIAALDEGGIHRLNIYMETLAIEDIAIGKKRVLEELELLMGIFGFVHTVNNRRVPTPLLARLSHFDRDILKKLFETGVWGDKS